MKDFSIWWLILVVIIIGGVFLAIKSPSGLQSPKLPTENIFGSKQTTPEPTQPVVQLDGADNDLENSKEIVAEKPVEQKEENMADKSAKKYSVVLHTSVGNISIALNDTQTPKTVENFVTLAKKGFYDKTIFHRAISGFMIQGGDPKGDGTGGPGYKFEDEPFTGEYERGTVAMANAGPNTNGSQFFIMHQDYPLPKNYTIFGHVTAGLDAVDKIATAPVSMNAGGEKSKPEQPVQINSVEVIEN